MTRRVRRLDVATKSPSFPIELLHDPRLSLSPPIETLLAQFSR
jgi:hypothetical protein